MALIFFLPRVRWETCGFRGNYILELFLDNISIRPVLLCSSSSYSTGCQIWLVSRGKSIFPKIWMDPFLGTTLLFTKYIWFIARYAVYICKYTSTSHPVIGQLITTQLNLLGLNGVNLFPQQKMTKLAKLLLANNQLEAVPYIPDSVRILHLQVCIFYY